MSLSEQSRERVEDALARLEAQYGDVVVVDDEWHVSEAEYGWIVDRFDAGTVGGAGVWVRNDDGAVLLVREEGEDCWSEPSGKHEPGESLAETARRELAEETGISCRLTDVELAQVVRMRTPGEPPLHRLVVVFGGENVSGTVEPAPGEIAEARWWERRPGSLRYDALEELDIPASSE